MTALSDVTPETALSLLMGTSIACACVKASAEREKRGLGLICNCGVEGHAPCLRCSFCSAMKEAAGVR